MTPEEQAERASLAGALAEYHAHPGEYLLPVLEAGCWTLTPYLKPPVVASGYTYQPPKDWLEAPDYTTAMDVYRLQRGRVGYPVPGIDPATGQQVQLLHPRIGKIGAAGPKGMSMGDYLALQAQVKAPPSPGSSAKAAELKDADRVRITEELRLKRERESAEERLKAERAAARALKKAAKEAEEVRRRVAQGSMLAEEGA